MSQNSSCGHGHHHHSGSGSILTAFLLNFTFTIFELVGGLYIGSNAILSDAVHDLGDSISLGMAYFLEKKSQQKKDEFYSYGYQRLSLLSALISGTIILLGSGAIIFKTVYEWKTPNIPNPNYMMGMALIGVLVNGAAAFKVKKGKSLNEKMITWHLLEDLLGWVVVFVGAIVLKFTEWPYLDSVLALFLSLFVVYNVLKHFTETIRLFLQASPSSFDSEAFKEELLKSPHIVDVHDLHIWSLDGVNNVMSFHLLLKRELVRDQVLLFKNEIRENLKGQGQFHVTIETEFEGQDCTDNCDS